MVQRYFEYCSLVWGNCGESGLKEKLQKLQNRAARDIIQVILMIYTLKRYF
jgi:hypothetical protein